MGKMAKALQCYSVTVKILPLPFGFLNKISYLCEKFRYEKFRLWKIHSNSGHW